jgi:hypothetical protein
MVGVSSWRQQALIEAPIEVVWALVGDPRRYPEWARDVIEVTGLATVDEGAEFTRVGRLPLTSTTTTFVIDALEEMKHIRLRCTRSGMYGDYVLTEAQGATFADAEVGMDPTGLQYRALDAMLTKRWYHSVLVQSLDRLRDVAERERAPSSP